MKKEVLSVPRCSVCDETAADRVKCTQCGKVFEMVCLDVEIPSSTACDEPGPKSETLYPAPHGKKLIEWGDQYLLGLKDVDDQHFEIVQLINSVHESVNSGARDHDFVLRILKTLDHYVDEHFAFEEKLFRAAKYPGLDQQIREHRVFSSQVKELHNQFEKSFFDLRSVLRFMVGWFMEHTQGSDKQFVQYWKEAMKKKC